MYWLFIVKAFHVYVIFVADIYIQNYIFLENEITHNINNGFNKKKESSPCNYNDTYVEYKMILYLEYVNIFDLMVRVKKKSVWVRLIINTTIVKIKTNLYYSD